MHTPAHTVSSTSRTTVKNIATECVVEITDHLHEKKKATELMRNLKVESDHSRQENKLFFV